MAGTTTMAEQCKEDVHKVWRASVGSNKHWYIYEKEKLKSTYEEKRVKLEI